MPDGDALVLASSRETTTDAKTLFIDVPVEAAPGPTEEMLGLLDGIRWRERPSTK
jgi:hypothetical protein